ncbi:hypothetical protein L218DRAFT_1006526 [Marasmius fiardii PR-910]|nr:hypothetical protein L218DRAFT_1006526 [Marasmius fiardii PR-910]
MNTHFQQHQGRVLGPFKSPTTIAKNSTSTPPLAPPTTPLDTAQTLQAPTQTEISTLTVTAAPLTTSNQDNSAMGRETSPGDSSMSIDDTGQSTTSAITSAPTANTISNSTTSSSTPSRPLVMGSTTVTESTLITQTSIMIASDNKNNTPVIAGSAVGAVAFLSVLVCVTYLRRRRSSYEPTLPPSTSAPGGISPFVALSLGSSSPKNKLQSKWDIMYPSAELDNQSGATDREGSEQVNVGQITRNGGDSSARAATNNHNTIQEIPSNPPPSYRP